jgi:hypothetical protein
MIMKCMPYFVTHNSVQGAWSYKQLKMAKLLQNIVMKNQW